VLFPVTPVVREALRLYRSTGADPLFGDPRAAHGVAREGYYWRFTDPASGRVVIALNGVNRGPHGHWATLGLAASNGFVRTELHPAAQAAPARLGAFAGTAFAGTSDRVHVDLGPGARLEVSVRRPIGWPRRSTGGSGAFQTVPALNQYWHPWLLGGVVTGSTVVGEETWDLDGWTVFAEKSWGRGGVPDSWWWGQAHGFAEAEACVAFAGGQVSVGPLRTTLTALVVLLPDGTLLRLGDPLLTPVNARVSDEWWLLRGRSAQWHVEVDGFGRVGAAHVLPVPLPLAEQHVPGAIEHLSATMRVRVRHRGRLAWSGESRAAGLVLGGIERARAEVTRRGHADAATAAPVE
jgi:hypothetical protein